MMEHLTFLARCPTRNEFPDFGSSGIRKFFFSPKHVYSAVFTGKAKATNWIAINLMLKYSDMFLEGCRMTNVAP